MDCYANKNYRVIADYRNTNDPTDHVSTVEPKQK